MRRRAAAWVTQVCGWMAATRSRARARLPPSPHWLPTPPVSPAVRPLLLLRLRAHPVTLHPPSPSLRRPLRIACLAGDRDPSRPRNNFLGMVADTESSDSLPGTSSANAAAETPADGSLNQRSQEKIPKKTHKAEREKLKRDQLNDLFVELSSMLDLDRQNAGKASVLGDTARVLRDLMAQVESLRKEQSALVSERRYVSSEKNELQDENTTLKIRISELQNELCAMMGNSSHGMSIPMANAATPDLSTHPMPHQMWNNTPNLSSAAMTHLTYTASPFHSQHDSADAGQGYAPRPQELQLFPGASSSPDTECSGLRSDQATSSSLTDSLPGQLCLSLPQSSQEGSSSGVARSRKERRNG